MQPRAGSTGALGARKRQIQSDPPRYEDRKSEVIHLKDRGMIVSEFEKEDMKTIKVLGYYMGGFGVLTVALIITAQLIA